MEDYYDGNGDSGDEENCYLSDGAVEPDDGLISEESEAKSGPPKTPSSKVCTCAEAFYLN